MRQTRWTAGLDATFGAHEFVLRSINSSLATASAWQDIGEITARQLFAIDLDFDLYLRHLYREVRDRIIGTVGADVVHDRLDRRIRGIIEHEINALTGREVPVVDSAHATAEELAAVLGDRALTRSSDNGGGITRLLVTDMPSQFADSAARFLGRSVADLNVEQVDLAPAV